MLFREILIQELNSKREDFAQFAESQSDELEHYHLLLEELSAKKSVEVTANLGDKEVGAVPSAELDRFQSIKLDFKPRWRNHEEARSWAATVLHNRTTFAADGSQIQPGREVSLPVAAIQVGTFENPHTADGKYFKQAILKIIPPSELLDETEFDEKPINPETKVGLRRFQAESEAVERFLERKSGWLERGERMPLAFFDGTLLISFSQPNSDVQRQFINSMRRLVLLSKETQVPLVGFVDQSYARDLIGLLDAVKTNLFKSNTLTDAQLLSYQTLANWGERTIFFYSRRRGLSDYFVDENNNPLVGLIYLQTTGSAAPARLDIPAWVYEKDLLAEVTDTVRAECVTGLGYPYVLESADATAVISVRDREIFLRALQDFSVRENLNFSVSNKRASKARRR